MNKNILHVFFFVTMLAGAEEKKEFRFKVSYVSAYVVYIDAGREQHVTLGDTLKIQRDGKLLGTVVISAISNHSSAAQILSPQSSFIIGDAAVIEKYIPVEEKKTEIIVKKDSLPAVQSPPQAQVAVHPQSANENIVSGRLGLQYSGVFTDNSRLNLSQPSALLRLDVANLYGTGMVFTMHSRNYYDLSDYYNRYGESSRLKNRIYEFALQRDVLDGDVGYGFGRMTSRFVGELGTFDGGQFYVRQHNVTTGFIFGAKIGDRTMAIDGDDKKGAVFVNYRTGTDFFHQYDGTIAYGRQLLESKLDREFLYLQNSLSLSSDLSIYESTEIELNDIKNGTRTSAFTLSNTFLSVNYYPFQWFSTNVGYDATRSVYLFETMRSIPDTLFDKNIMQGYRASTNFRFPYFITLSLNGSYRIKKGDARNSHNIGATVRMSDIAGSEAGAALRYANIAGVFSDGNNITLDLDRTFFNTLSVSLRYDYYTYTIIALNRQYTTHTVTANLNYRISRTLYSLLSADRVLDTAMKSYRVYAEIGIRF